MYILKAQEFPNREKRVTLYVSRRSQRKEGSPNEGGLFYCKSQDETNESHCETKDGEGEPPLLTLGANSKPSKCGYGVVPKPTRFTLRAKRTILRAGGAMDSLPGGVEKRVFFTGTLPGSTQGAMVAIAAWSAWIVNAWKAWIAKRIHAKYDFYVWELQRRGALHFHYCIYIDKEADRKWFLVEAKNEWVRLLKLLSAKSGVDCFARSRGGSWRDYPRLVQAYAQPCKKSVAAYLSKYCGKSSGKSTGQYCPTRWWGVSRPLRDLLRSLTVERLWQFARRGQAETAFEDLLHDLEAACENGYRRYCDRSGFAEVAVGYTEAVLWKEQIEKLKGCSKSSTGNASLAAASMSRLHGLICSGYFLSGKHSEISGIGQFVAESGSSQLARFPLEKLLSLIEQFLSELYWKQSVQAEVSYVRLREVWLILSRAFRRVGCSPTATFLDLKEFEMEAVYAAIGFRGDISTRSAASAPNGDRSDGHGRGGVGISPTRQSDPETLGVCETGKGSQSYPRSRRGRGKPLGQGSVPVLPLPGQQLHFDGILGGAGDTLDGSLRYPLGNY